MHAAATAGGAEVENRNGLPLFTSHSIRWDGPAMNPPRTPMAFDRVPTWMSTRLASSPKWATVPLPPGPSTPLAWASSIIMIAPCFSATSTRAGSGAMSPSIENTPSVISSCRRPGAFDSSSSLSAAAASLCGKTLISARDSRAPSMIEAWFNWSETITSSLARIAATVPEFAVNPDWNMIESSAPLKAANRRSSSR
jgi:hypothetical protein